MSVLWLTDMDIERLLPMDRAMAAVEAAFRDLGIGEADNRPRSRAQSLAGLLAVTGPAAVPALGFMGFKVFSVGLPPFHSNTRAPAVFALYDAAGGALLAVMEAEALGFIRTGAATGIATAWMSRPDSRVAGMFGTGRLAMAQLEAVARARPLTEIRVLGRDAEKCTRFCAAACERLGVRAAPAGEAREVIEGCDIVITATTAGEPLFDAAWLAPGTHVNAVGANFADRREISVETPRRAAVVAVDALDQARMECGDLIAAVASGDVAWSDVVELGAIVAGRRPGRTSPEDITLFESQGIAIEDVAAAGEVYKAFRAQAALGEWVEAR